MRHLLKIGAAVAAMTMVASNADAVTYILTNPATSAYELVKITPHGLDRVHIALQVSPGWVLDNDGGPIYGALNWNVAGDPVLDVTNLPAPFYSNGPTPTGTSYKAFPMGTFMYRVFFPTHHGTKDTNPSTLAFDVTGAGLKVASFIANAKGNLFASGIYEIGTRKPGIELNVGGGGKVPEPATWAMMVVGLGMAGGAMRARRRATVGAANDNSLSRDIPGVDDDDLIWT